MLIAPCWPPESAPWCCENRICRSNPAASSMTCRPLWAPGCSSVVLFLSMVGHLFCGEFCLGSILCPSLVVVPFYPLPLLEFFQGFGDMERADPDNSGVLRQATASRGVGVGAV